jgi:E3 ubiquitin-protein ligase KCMF1
MEVICPICAASPGGEPNLKTDDLAEHLTLEHQRGGGVSGGSTFEFINEPSAIRHGAGVRRISRAAVGPGSVRSARRSNPNFSPSNQDPVADRESADLFAELQQTLAGGSRRQLQQLQMQIQMERQAIENRITNMNRRATGTSSSGSSNTNQASISIQRILSAMSNSGSSRTEPFMSSSSPAARSQLLTSVGGSGNNGSGVSGTQTSSSNGSSQLSFIPAGIQLQTLATTQNQDATSIQVPMGQFLMPRFLAPSMSEDEREQLEKERIDR